MVLEEAIVKIQRLEARIQALEEDAERAKNPKKLRELEEKLEETERQLRKELISVDVKRREGEHSERERRQSGSEDARGDLDKFIFPRS